MNVLIVNDDGIDCEGIQVLANRMSLEHNVYILAPDSNRSGVSHYINMFRANAINRKKEGQWCCSGFPADCTCIGLKSGLFGVDFDVVLSGINRGANMGTDIVYSGTCAGARQAVFCGVPGIALSIDPVDYKKAEAEGYKYYALADFAAKNINTLMGLAKLQPPRMFVNVNGASLDSYKGVKISKSLCIRNYNDSFGLTGDDGHLISNFFPGKISGEYEIDSDAQIVRDGYICVNQVYADPVCNEVMDGISFKL